ncbi:MAG: hypothetical protein MZV70_19305 [Desulfobacterales bacterium]|nr:hypothetical protein [Desulfobacterales bacterium]
MISTQKQQQDALAAARTPERPRVVRGRSEFKPTLKPKEAPDPMSIDPSLHGSPGETGQGDGFRRTPQPVRNGRRTEARGHEAEAGRAEDCRATEDGRAGTAAAPADLR